jgi:hypothetical protein
MQRCLAVIVVCIGLAACPQQVAQPVKLTLIRGLAQQLRLQQQEGKWQLIA